VPLLPKEKVGIPIEENLKERGKKSYWFEFLKVPKKAEGM